MGSDNLVLSKSLVSVYFNPRSPCGERLVLSTGGDTYSSFQSTLPVWGATSLFIKPRFMLVIFQSTLPVWGATKYIVSACREGYISIHAPRVGSDLNKSRLRAKSAHFNPRSPCGERQKMGAAKTPGHGFQSTLPVWGATGSGFRQRRKSAISIHAPRVGSDVFYDNYTKVRKDFNPRSPCGERRSDSHPASTEFYFNPRSPCGERR